MWNNLPQISPKESKEGVQKEQATKKLVTTSPKINIKGITLKQYFRICDEPNFQGTINEDEGESHSSSKSSLAQTPSFPLPDTKRNGRQKIKTEVCEQQSENHFKNNMIKVAHERDYEYTSRAVLNQPISEKNHKMYFVRGENNPFKKKEERKKVLSKLHSQSTKHQAQLLNTSTLSYFYQAEDNKRKMLKKMQADKDRVNDLRLSDAFFITKYGSRFRIDSKQLIIKQG